MRWPTNAEGAMLTAATSLGLVRYLKARCIMSYRSCAHSYRVHSEELEVVQRQWKAILADPRSLARGPTRLSSLSGLLIVVA
jgi:hypothetical protein